MCAKYIKSVHQARKPLRLEGGLRLIKRWAGAAERRRRPGNRLAVDIDRRSISYLT
jgi:hypothetical protein